MWGEESFAALAGLESVVGGTSPPLIPALSRRERVVLHARAPLGAPSIPLRRDRRGFGLEEAAPVALLAAGLNAGGSIALAALDGLFASAAKLGYGLGNVLAVVMNFPQVWESWRTGKAGNVSAAANGIGAAASLISAANAVLDHKVFLAWQNLVGLYSFAAVLGLKYWLGRRPAAPASAGAAWARTVAVAAAVLALSTWSYSPLAALLAPVANAAWIGKAKVAMQAASGAMFLALFKPLASRILQTGDASGVSPGFAWSFAVGSVGLGTFALHRALELGFGTAEGLQYLIYCALNALYAAAGFALVRLIGRYSKKAPMDAAEAQRRERSAAASAGPLPASTLVPPGTVVQLVHSPDIGRTLKPHLEQAAMLRGLFYSFTNFKAGDRDFKELLLELKERGAIGALVLDHGQSAGKYALYPWLKKNGFEVYRKVGQGLPDGEGGEGGEGQDPELMFPGIMHEKVWLITLPDGRKLLAFGSANATGNASGDEAKNDENLVLFLFEPGATGTLFDHFERRYEALLAVAKDGEKDAASGP